MKKRKLINISLLIFLLLFLLNSPRAAEKVNARGEVWRLLEFDSGQCFTYELKLETQGVETTGEITFWVADERDEMIRLITEGNFNGETFTASAPGKAGDIRDIENIFMNFMRTILVELPYEVNEVLSYTIFFSPWLEIPVDKIELGSGHKEYITDSNEDSYFLEILNNRSTYAGFEGYLIQMQREEEDLNIEMCINPGMPLPLMTVRNSGIEGVFAAELSSYTTASDIPEWEKKRAVAESELLKVLE